MKNKIKGLRTGYTTGSCAAAASKAATMALINGQAPEKVTIELPVGKRATFDIVSSQADSNSATCSVIKDAGDDPDVTHGARLSSTVSFNNGHGIFIIRGEGVGIVTKPGLELEVGMPAINKVPRRMINQAVSQVASKLVEETGLSVVISVKNGEEIAKETLNPRLGILEGLSILGTTGIVKPYSTEAYKLSIALSINVAVAAKRKHLVFTTGTRSEEFSKKFVRLAEECYVQVGDFPRYAVKRCTKCGIEKITFCGMIGKLSKIAEGHSQTHVSKAKINIDFLIELAREYGVDEKKTKLMQNAQTARHFSEIALQSDEPNLFNLICKRVCRNLKIWSKNNLAVECIMTDFSGNLIGRYVS